MSWTVTIHKKVKKGLNKLPKNVQEAFESLVVDLQDGGGQFVEIGQTTQGWQMGHITAI